MTNREQVLKRLKTAIFIILAIFIVSFVALALRIVYVSFFADQGTTVVVPNNIVETKELSSKIDGEISSLMLVEQTDFVIADPDTTVDALLCEKPTEPQIMLLSAGSTQAAVVELYRGQSADNDAFTVRNMFPGDTVTKYYCLKVYHKADVAVHFKVTDLADTKSLGNILHIKVTKLDETAPQTLCDDSFANVENEVFHSAFPANSDQETIAYYRVDVSLPSLAGNEYQGASLTATFNWYAENPDPTPPAHTCESKCPICRRCLDMTCTYAACSEKCHGHTVIPPTHTCESKCPICRRCLDMTCTYAACSGKCPGHTVTPPAHICEHKCPECGKCLDAVCTDPACSGKCPGHTVTPPAHICEHKCPECGKCLDAVCTDPACSEKCPGHTVTPPAHICEHKCPECGKCLDAVCTDPACAEKCHGHGAGLHECESECPECGKCQNKDCKYNACREKCECSPLVPKPRKYIIWPWTIVPALSLISLIILIIIFFKKRKEGDNV